MDVDLADVVGMSLRDLRLQRGLTLRETAKKANISLGFLSEIERGRKEPSWSILQAICSALDLKLSVHMVDADGARHESSLISV